MKAMDFNSRWVLVTGASSGLGAEMARQLAREHGASLILVARRRAQLETLKAELEQYPGVRCQVIAADLALPADVERVYAEATAMGDIHGVVLNAGVTYFGRHTDMSQQAFDNLLAVNVSSVVRLVSLFTPYLLEKNQGGGLLAISSMAGLLPVPYQAAYAGSKAFLTNFAQSMQQELRGENVSFTVFSPGGIDTEMTRGSELRYFANSVFMQDAASCARDAINAFQQRESLHVPGALNRLELLLARLVPRRVVGRVTELAYRAALSRQ